MPLTTVIEAELLPEHLAEGGEDGTGAGLGRMRMIAIECSLVVFTTIRCVHTHLLKIISLFGKVDRLLLGLVCSLKSDLLV